jgi:hypothetical protein
MKTSKLRIHTVPAGDSTHHVIAKSCWCYPVESPVDDVDPDGTYLPTIVAHNAQDLRDARERVSGKGTPGKGWDNVCEEVWLDDEETVPV